MNEAEQLVFSNSPTVEFASNLFTGVPVILQADDAPLIEMVKEEKAGFTTQISIYHKDGTHLAKVKGSQLYLTPDGEKAGLKLRHPGLLTVCELENETLFELRRDHAAALKLTAELYTPTGGFIKGHKYIKYVETFGSGGVAVRFPEGLILGLKDLRITCDQAEGVGIHLHSEGWIGIGFNCKVRQEWQGDPTEQFPAHMWLKLQPGGPDSALSNCKFGPDEVIKKYAMQAPQSN
jgi:hypothetical protein